MSSTLSVRKDVSRETFLLVGAVRGKEGRFLVVFTEIVFLS